MYKIIGGDGKQYGPISADQIRAWLAEGRLNPDSSIQSDPDPQWKPLRTFPELQALCSGNVPAPTVPPKTCGMAVASLVLGCLTLFCSLFTAIPGIIFGILGLNKIDRSGGKLTGEGMAITGICLSGVLFVFGIGLQAAMLLPALSSARGKAQKAQCLSNLKQLGLAVGMYYDDNKDSMPVAGQWCDQLKPYAGGNEKLFRCPNAPPQQRCSYAFNPKAKWQGVKDVVMIIDGADQWNAVASGPRELRASSHRDGYSVLFNDGHVEFVRKERLAQLQW